MSNKPAVDGTIWNPVLRGFNPDPSIAFFRGEYVIATSTFEWFPGIRLHRSSDLVRWETVGHALDERLAFDLSGIPDSGGVWAPSLTVVDDRLWLAYSVVHTMDGDDLDAKNYLITSDSLAGPWTEPIFLGSRGFDFSFFHDEGRHWLVGVQWDDRPDQPSFSGIVLEEYLPATGQTAGRPQTIFRSDGLVEGPNLYRFGDSYLLTLAEGGTGWNHGIAAAQAPAITGPYRRDPAAAVLTSRDSPGLALQKAGHGELVQRPDGQLFLVHLAARPILHQGSRYSILGRETCLQKVRLDEEGWPRLLDGSHHPQTTIPLGPGDLPDNSAPEVLPGTIVDQFDELLDMTRWSSLRRFPSFVQSIPGGGLGIRGGDSSGSLFGQSLIAQRVTEHQMVAEAVVDADPGTSRQSAALTLWYDTKGWFALQITQHPEYGKVVRLLTRVDDTTMVVEETPVTPGPQRLHVVLESGEAVFSFGSEDGELYQLGKAVPAWKLSDDYGGGLRFTGLFVGVRVDDLDGVGWSATLRRFTLQHGATKIDPA